MPKAAYSIDEFCEDHGICRATLYNLWSRGEGPRFFHIGRRRLITAEAAADYRRDLEARAAEAA